MTIDVTKPLELEDGTPVKLEDGIGSSVRVRYLTEPSRFTSGNTQGWDYEYGFFHNKETGEFNGSRSKVNLKLRNKFMSIDVTKPLELDDGTPVEFVEIDSPQEKRRSVRVKYLENPQIRNPASIAKRVGEMRNYYLDDGSYLGQSTFPKLRNKTMASSSFNSAKPITTRSGNAVRVISSDRKGSKPIVALVTMENGDEETFTYCINGAFHAEGGSESQLDLINPVERVVKRRSVLLNKDGTVSTSTPTTTSSNRVGLIELTIENGKLVDVSIVNEETTKPAKTTC